MGGRVPPHDLDAEAAVLSAVLLAAEAFDRVQEVLLPEHFYADAHRRIFEGVLDLHSANKPVDLVTVASRFGASVPPAGTLLSAAIAEARSAKASLFSTAPAISAKPVKRKPVRRAGAR